MIMITISFARNSLQNWFSSSIAITPCQALRKGDMLKISLLFYNSTISMCRYVIKCLPTILWFFPERTKLKISSKKKTLIRLTFALAKPEPNPRNPWHVFPLLRGLRLSESFSVSNMEKKSKLLKTWPQMMMWQEWWLNFRRAIDDCIIGFHWLFHQ